jgi:hypothetical protein
VTQRPIETNLGEDTTIEQVRKWLNECLTTHSESQPHGEAQSTLPRFTLPTRVIDVGTESDPVARLSQPSSPRHEDYIALSYCWGSQPFLTTISSNVKTHFEGFKESKLPQTFIDAIKVARKLHFRYLWIDALCIIQDSIEDKAIEIGAMESIYSNSTLTMAIVNTTQVTDGFLKTKSRRMRVEIPYCCPDGTVGSIQISPQDTIDLWQEPLYSRAWCLQENLLSPRLLLFTDTEVVWQCQSCPMRRPKTSHVEYLYDNPQLGSSPFARILESVSSAGTQNLMLSPGTGLELSRYTMWRVSWKTTLGAILPLHLIASLPSQELPRSSRLPGQMNIALVSGSDNSSRLCHGGGNLSSSLLTSITGAIGLP